MASGSASPVPPMPNYYTYHEHVPTAYCAGNIVSHVDELMGALAEAHEVNKWWSLKYMQCRSDHIAKALPACGTKTQTRAFQGWKDYIFTKGNIQRLARLQDTMGHFEEDAEITINDREKNHQEALKELQSQHDTRVDELAVMIEKQNSQCKELLRERDYYGSRDDLAGELLSGMRSMMDATPDHAYSVGGDTVKEHAGDFEYCKNVMHEILNEVDPTYVPPMGALHPARRLM